MNTQEIILNDIPFKEIIKKTVKDFYYVEEDTTIDNVASTALFNEKGELMAAIIGEKLDCYYKELKGEGCHIRCLRYSKNIVGCILNDLLKTFNTGVQFAMKDTKEGIIYRYSYLWFEIPQVENSILTSLYSNYEIFTLNDKKICILPITRNTPK